MEGRSTKSSKLLSFGAIAANDAALAEGVDQSNANHQTDSETITKNGRAKKLAQQVHYWLEWQSRMISGVDHGAVLLSTDSGEPLDFHETAWPNASIDLEQLRELAGQAIRADKTLVRSNVPSEQNILDLIACPLRKEAKVCGAVIFSIASRTDAQIDAVVQLLQWCTIWLENLLNDEDSQPDVEQAVVSHSVAIMADINPLPVISHLLCRYLAEEFDCVMVALGTVERTRVRTLSVSTQIGFDQKMEGVVELECAMEESVAQRRRIDLPLLQDEACCVIQAHTTLLEQSGDTVVCTVPFGVDGEFSSVLSLIKKDHTPFTTTQLKVIERLTSALAPVVELQKFVNRSQTRQMLEFGKSLFGRLLGPKNLRLKTITSLVVLLPLLLFTIPVTQRVTAQATLEGALQQAIVTPIDGYIKSVHVRAGDLVAANQPLVTMNDSELTLQFEKWTYETEKLKRENQLAWATRDKAQVAILSSKIAQNEAQLSLIESQLALGDITAPFDGLIISGDLIQSVGAPIARGQLLFQLVPLEGFKVVLHVDEFDVEKLVEGQDGVLRLSSLPDELIEFKVSEAFPVASVSNGKSTFRVEALLANPPETLRPGMSGVGKIAVGKGSIGEVWTQPLRERLVMWLWYYGL